MLRRRLTHRIDVKESARRPRDAFEHVVMERHRGSHAEDKETDGSDDGDNTEAGHESTIDAKIEKVHFQRLLAVRIKGGNVACHKRGRSLDSQSRLLCLHILARPITQPHIRAREENLGCSTYD